MAHRLPAPAPAVKRALALLPHQPGVYMLRDQAGRVIYVGRSRDLAGRVRSYWIDLKDRPHLARMVARVSWVEPVLCSSEHEAAFLESDLLERHPTRYNRTLGMESCVWLRLDAGAKSPGLDVEHEARPGDGAEWFGPYLGWEPTRQAAAGLLKLYPLRYAGDELGRTERELARSLGVSTGDRLVLAGHIRRVLRREPDAVRGTIRRLEQTRDSAAEALMFESAAAAQDQIRGLQWISEAQNLAGLVPAQGDFSAISSWDGATVGVVLSLRRGRLAQRHVVELAEPNDWPGVGDSDQVWTMLAQANANLMAKLSAAEAIGPMSWRYGTRLMRRSAT